METQFPPHLVTMILPIELFSLYDGGHPLWYISYCGRRDLIDLFLQHGAEIELPKAVRYHVDTCEGATVKGDLFLQHGAEVDLSTATRYILRFAKELL